MTTTCKKGFRIGALNCNGLSTSLTKQNKILAKLTKDECDLIVLTDTRLTKDNVENSPIFYNHEAYVVNPIIEKKELRPAGKEAS